jgi:subtilisin family serine protease
MSPPLRIGSALVVMLLALAACAEDPAEVSTTPVAPAAAFAPEHANGQYLVRYSAVFTPRTLTSTITQAGGSIVYDFPPIGLMVVSGLDRTSARQLDARGDILGVAPDYTFQWIPREPVRLARQRRLRDASRVAADQSDAAFFADQWNLRNIGAPVAWRETPSGAGAVVCVLDTGVDPGQLDLAGKVDLAKSASFVPSEPFIEDLNTHGTFISALISSNGIGIASVAPGATLCAIKVLSAAGAGSFSAVSA